MEHFESVPESTVRPDYPPIHLHDGCITGWSAADDVAELAAPLFPSLARLAQNVMVHRIDQSRGLSAG